jgi:hypothetical protein
VPPRLNEDFNRLETLYKHGDFHALTATEEGLFYLTLRSLARKENLLYVCQRIGMDTVAVPIRDLPRVLYTSPLTLDILQIAIRDLYTDERAERKAGEKALLAELFKLRVFDWGGIHQNDINKHLVDNYIKKITNFDDLVNKIETEVLQSLKGFVLCSWYNNWTSLLIEDIFKDHPRVLPTVGKIKQVDFFVDNIPFDLKVTYFPSDFLKSQRKQRGLVQEELSELKRACKRFQIPFDNARPAPDLMLDIITALSEHSESAVQQYYNDFVATRKAIIADTVANPRPLLQWLYENQGIQRFDASNRLFLILVNQDNLEESWKLKRDYPLLQREIVSYLDSRSFLQQDLLLNWSVDNHAYQSYTDALFILK